MAGHHRSACFARCSLTIRAFFIAQILRRGREAGDGEGTQALRKRGGAPQSQSRGASFANIFS
jgi:hypothetical protein